MLETSALPFYELVSASIALISFGVSIFLACILFSIPSNYKTNVYLGFTLLIGSAVFLLRLLVVTKSNLAIYAPFFVFPSAYLIGPLLFFYTRAILFKRDASKTELFRYSLPSLLSFLVFLLLYQLYPEFRDINAISKQEHVVGFYTTMILISIMAFISYFCILSMRYIFLYQKELENEFSQNVKGRLLWLKSLIGINLLNICAYFSLSILFFTGQLVIPPLTPIESFINLGMIYLILYYLIKKPDVITLQYLEENLKSLPKDLLIKKSDSKYSKQSLALDERKSIIVKIKREMSERKPFLEESISLKDLSDRTGIPAHHLSMSINAELGQNFFQFINSYRIEEACLLLAKPEFQNQNVLNVGLLAGFQSKAAFNKAFKAATGKTPTEYRLALRA